MRRHFESAEFHQATTARGAAGIVHLVDAELGAVGVAGDIRQDVAEHPVHQPGRAGWFSRFCRWRKRLRQGTWRGQGGGIGSWVEEYQKISGVGQLLSFWRDIQGRKNDRNNTVFSLASRLVNRHLFLLSYPLRHALLPPDQRTI